MKLTPLDIRKQEFKNTIRGFDPDEVEAFLSMVADEMELLNREKNQINDELIKLRTQLKDYQDVESTLRDTLVKAQNTVEDSRANSRREAEIIIHEAELQADNIIKEAREQLIEIKHEINAIRAQKESFAKRLRHLLESQIELLETLEIDDIEPQMIKTGSMLTRRGRLPQSTDSMTQKDLSRTEYESRLKQSTENPESSNLNNDQQNAKENRPVHIAKKMTDENIKQKPDSEKTSPKEDDSGGRISDQFVF